jgi:hypothetical protein
MEKRYLEELRQPSWALSMESALMIDKRVLQLVEKRGEVSASFNCCFRVCLLL